MSRRSVWSAVFVLGTAVGLGMVAVADSQAADKAQPIKALLITGGCCHDYKVSVYQQPGWAKKYDVIVHNECFGGVTDDAFVQSIAAAHREGTAAVFIHCALHSYRSAPLGADSWRELIGVTSRRHEKHRPVTVKTLNAGHPVMLGFPAEWKTPNGELYIIERVWPNATPLAQAYGEDTRQDHVCIWANHYGKARVFGTSLGHHNETMNNDIWLGLVSRGLLWSCGKLQDDGTPAVGYEGTGIKPIVLPELKPEPDPKSKK